LREQPARHHDLANLEDHRAAVPDDPGADLGRQGQSTQGIGQVLGQRMKL
jgi:hypothetical protein